MALPLAMLKSLQMRTSAKVGLAGVFCCAFITIGFDILRAVETEKKGDIKGSTALWTNLESAVAVIVSCLPSLAALFSPKNKHSDCKNRGLYRQRSLIVSDSAKLYINIEGSVKNGYSGQTSAAEGSAKTLVPFSGAMLAPIIDDFHCKEGFAV